MQGLSLFVANQPPPSARPPGVRWKFRFDWCESRLQETPWWSSVNQPDRPRTQPPPDMQALNPTWRISGPNAGGTMTVRRGSPFAQPDDEQYAYQCPECSAVSERVFKYGDICLNENCEWYFGDATPDTSDSEYSSLLFPSRC
jgi:hypothetical protein